MLGDQSYNDARYSLVKSRADNSIDKGSGRRYVKCVLDILELIEVVERELMSVLTILAVVL